jgi:hypothetical protein
MTTASKTSDPDDRSTDVTSVQMLDECLVAAICIDRFLWKLYLRTPKVDDGEVYERKEVTIRRNGRTLTISRQVAKTVDSDFA